MKNIISFIISTILWFCIFVTSCNHSTDTATESVTPIVAQVGNISITLREVDAHLEKQLYDILIQIYQIRNDKIDYIIEEKLFELESQKYHMAQNELLDSVLKRINNIKIKDQLIEKESEYFLLEKYIDSLKIVYNVKKSLTLPPLPKIITKEFKAYYRGNVKSAVTLYLVSDLECPACQEINPIYNHIFHEYKDKVRFAFCYFSANVTTSALALECADRQHKFGAMYDSLSNLKKTVSLYDIFTIASNMQLDMDKFSNDMQDSKIRHSIFNSFTGTPTIIVNNQILLDTFSITAIEKALNDALAKNN